MAWSFPIGHLFGSELRVHVTFFLLLAWIGIAGYLETGPAGAVLYMLYVVILFACVIAHEFGHALTARRFGIKTPDVTLLPIGGVARMEKMPEKPGQEILVALAGPAVNIVIFTVLTLIFGSEAVFSTALTDLSFPTLLAQVAFLNLVLAVFNLIPAFPMDGGRVLRAALSAFMGRARATRVAATAGQVLAFAMGLAGLVIGNPILLLIAFFIFISAGAESADEAIRMLSRGMAARDAMITEFETLAPNDSLDAAATTLIRTTQHEFPVMDPVSGQLQGFLTRRALYAALDSSPRPANVGAVMTRDLPATGLNDSLSAVLDKLRTGAPAVAVLGIRGDMIGYVTAENLGELMVVTGARKRRTV